VPGTDGTTHERIKCYNDCNTPGHYASVCLKEEDEQGGVQMLQDAPETPVETTDKSYRSEFNFLDLQEQMEENNFVFHKKDQRYSIIPDTWILFDSQSTVSVFKNSKFLSNIRRSPNKLRVHTNGGTQFSSKMGTVTNFGDVWFNEDSLANILSMAAVRKVCRITMDTFIEAAMHVHRKDGTVMTFKEYKSGLYYYNAYPKQSNTTNAYLFLNTVACNKGNYTRREIEGANKARALYKKIGRPSKKEFNDILQNNLIQNCPVTSDDAKRALKIYGPDVATLKGKTVKKQNRGIPNYQAAQIPAPVIAQYNNVRLFVDVFWVNKSPYFHTISEWIKFRTVSAISNRYKRALLMETKAVTNMYETRGLNVTRIEGDREFACISNDVLPIPINIADVDDHAAKVERSIRTIKERTRCLIQGLPYKRIPRVMIRAAIENANKVMNQFPAQSGVPATLSPLTIMTGKPTPDYNDMKIEFGAYAQVFKENQITNTPITRTTGAIALTPTGNAQGGQFFMSLTTGRKLSRRQWDELPMPDGVITTVERMAQNENQPLLGQGAPLFEWSPGVTIEDDEDIHIVQDDDDHIEVIDG
jgi:hypothetical protein